VIHDDAHQVHEQAEHGRPVLDDAADATPSARGEGVPEATHERGDVVGAEAADDSGTQTRWTPAFPGQRPPFAPGNDLSLRHGVYSPRKIGERSAVVVAQLLEQPGVGYLQAPEYRASVWRYAQRQAKADLMHDRMLEHGEVCAEVTGCQVCESLERRWREFDTAAAKASERLGLDPLSRARLGKDVAQGRAADAAAELSRMREEAERAQVLVVEQEEDPS
jgi:hypothetical protein